MFEQPIIQFSDNLEALREFTQDVAPFLRNRLFERMNEDAESLMPLVYAISELCQDNPKIPLLDETTRNALREKFKDTIFIEKTEGEHSNSNENISIKIIGNLGHTVMGAAQRFHRRLQNTGLLYKNSLIALVSAAEWFLAQILHQYYKAYPDAIGGGHDKVFSFEDLKNFDTVEDARMNLIESKIENILRDNVSAWFKCLKAKPFELSLGYLEPYDAHLIEITQRRNLLIHNGGMVNSIYMSKVPKEARNDVMLGQVIEVSEEYIEKALEIFEHVFILIGAELWKKLRPTDEVRHHTLCDISWKHLMAERWSIVEGITYFMMRDKKQLEKHQLISQIDYWQSLKWQGRFDEIRPEVKKMDFSAKQKIFSLAQAALLDDEEQFFHILPYVLKSGEITQKALREWPLFRKIRETARYRGFDVSALEIIQQGSSTSNGV